MNKSINKAVIGRAKYGEEKKLKTLTSSNT